MSEYYQRLLGQEVPSNSKPRTQVYLATHDGTDKRLPHRERSFISFTYGKDNDGKRVNIEDFNLIATISGNMMERSLYGEFSDNTSTYDVLDGQFYWGTHFVNNKLNLQLSTDEMTEQQLQDFKAWFKPGPAKELVLSENPNRAIMARIGSTPQYHMLPFEKRVTKMFAGMPYEVSTTIYRGNIDIQFIMDDPFWYSIYNVLPSYGQDGAEDWFRTLGVDGSDSQSAAANSLLSNKDYLKIILEDGVPTREMIEGNIITGNEKYNSEALRVYGTVNDNLGNAKVGMRLGSASLSIASDGTVYLYYTGSAPAPTVLTFSLTPELTNNYISTPLNKIYNEIGDTGYNDYNKIVVGRQEFKFTTPSIYTGYNQALKIISSCEPGESLVDIKIKLIEGVNEYYSRAFALGTLNYLQKYDINAVDEHANIQNGFSTSFATQMQKFLTGEDKNTPNAATFSFNSKTGEAIGTFTIYQYIENKENDTITIGLSDGILVKENVGDMVYNKYLYLDEKNIYNDEGRITENECTPITTDYPAALQNFDIQYKHMYL